MYSFLKNLIIYYLYSVLSACQKREPDQIIHGCEPPYGCWELKSGPLEEQPVLLTTEPPFQPPHWILTQDTFLLVMTSESYNRSQRDVHKVTQPVAQSEPGAMIFCSFPGNTESSNTS